MKTTYLIIMALAFSLVAQAQKSETVKAGKKEHANREGEVFNFPDHIKLRKNELNERVEKKTQELTRLINKLAQKGEDADKDIAAAMKLFNDNEYALITVTRKSQPEPETVPVRTYLKRLSRLKYNKVNIVWHNAQYISNFARQPDGTYMGLVAFEQEFTGMMGGEINYTYRDVTQKRVEVVVKTWDAKDTDKNVAFVEVFLGNIGVTEE